jgi:aminoglycoside phosphotransferase (APT) family kinase protein
MTSEALEPSPGPVGAKHRFDEAALVRYLQARLPGFDQGIEIRQFQVGQSNPTYQLRTRAGDYVLRKKPAGELLPSAHAVDREFLVMRALADSQVPVPKMHLLCADESVIGQMFYVMEYVEGRNFPDPRMLEAPQAERRAMYLDLVAVLARLHALDYRAIGLQDFGKPQNYVARQVARWTKQYAASRVEDNADMDRLIAWVEARSQPADEVALAHGDYRGHNVLFAPREPRIAAVLDWEVATIGHPLADLAYFCLPYYLPESDARSFHGEDPAALGIPSEEEIKAAYCREAGRADLPDWRFFIIFSLFRTAAIRAGIYKRALVGTAASAQALETGLQYRSTAARGWALAQQSKEGA